jgi:PAS domain S-box-containing protein
VTTAEVATEFDCRRETIATTLQTLVDEGVLESKTVGKQEDVWWHPPRETMPPPLSASQDHPSTAQPTESAPDTKTIFELLDTTDIGIFILDSEFNVVWCNTAIERFFGLDRNTVIGHDKRTLIHREIQGTVDDPDSFVETVLATYDDNTFTEQFECHVTAGDERAERWLEHRSKPIPSGAYAGGRIELYYDITERKEHEQELSELTQRLTLALKATETGVWEWDTDTNEMVWSEELERMHNLQPGTFGGTYDSFIDYIHPDDRPTVEHEIEQALAGDGTLIAEFRMVRHQGEQIWIRAQGEMIADNDGKRMVGIAEDITERKHREQELHHHREQLAELNNINEVIQGITNAVIDQSTREEIEEIVCRRLAASESYEFAWIGEVDMHTQQVTLRTEAGVDGYLEDVGLSADPEAFGGQGPAGRAIRSKEMQVTQDALANPAFEPWQEYADRYGYRSMAAIPVVYGGTLYGLLGVYADRPKAFDGAVGDVIGQLGEIVGHAITATERKQALMSPEVTEIQFLVPDVLTDIDTQSTETGTITVDRAVPIGDETFLEYGTVDTAAVGLLETLVDQFDHFEHMEIVEQSADTSTFELQLSEPPIESVVASHGGYVQQLRIEGGDLQMSLHLPTTVSVRQVVDTIRETHPTATLLTRRQVTRSDESPQRVHRTLTDDLTERQRAVLETAVYSGFFEWPRNQSAAELADAFGVTPPTFHQHLRKAQKKVFESLLPSNAAD